MNVKLINERQRPTAEAWVLPYFQGERAERLPLWRRLTTADAKLVRAYFGRDFRGKDGEDRVVLLPGRRPARVILLGLGEKKHWTLRKLVLASRRAIRLANAHRILSLTLPTDSFAVPGVSLGRAAQTLAENAHLADYTFRQYKEKPKEGWPEVKRIELIGDDRDLRPAIRIGQVVGEETNECRRLQNTPGSIMTPARLAAEAQREGRQGRFRVTVFDESKIAKLKMGGVLAVARGSANRPKFITLEYRRAGRTKSIILVGKGVTFDSGGLNLKPGEHMTDMHLDMSGAAAVIHAIAAIARLKLKLNVVGLIPAVENMPGPDGFRPGDLVRSYSGKTIEINNTDAEGRVILADALSYAKRFEPSLVIDLATLTGSAMAALGQRAAALFTTTPKLEATLRQVGEVSGDYVWPLPLWSEYEADVKGTFGDVDNSGKTRYGGAITGAMFLWQFTKDYRQWAHLDIAPVMTTIEEQSLSKGGAGFGVRFLVELARRLAGR